MPETEPQPLREGDLVTWNDGRSVGTVVWVDDRNFMCEIEAAFRELGRKVIWHLRCESVSRAKAS